MADGTAIGSSSASRSAAPGNSPLWKRMSRSEGRALQLLDEIERGMAWRGERAALEPDARRPREDKGK